MDSYASRSARYDLPSSPVRWRLRISASASSIRASRGCSDDFIETLRNEAMRFSWTSLILAPLLVPVIFSTTFGILGEGEGDLLLASLTMLVLGCIASYGLSLIH